MATAPTIDVANLVAIKCKVNKSTVPEKTRHKTYAVEALAAVIEHFNSLNETKKINEHTCRTDYVHGSTRAFVFQVPAEFVEDLVLMITEEITFDTVDSLGSYTLGTPTRYTEAEQTATHTNSMWRGHLRVPAGFLHDPDHFSSQVRQLFHNVGLDIKRIAILRDREYGIATSDYTIEFASQDISGWVDVGYLQGLTEMKIQGRTQSVTVSFEPYKEIAAHWGVCKICLGIPARSCTCHKGKRKIDVAGTSTQSGTRAEAKLSKFEALKRKAKQAADARKNAMR